MPNPRMIDLQPKGRCLTCPHPIHSGACRDPEGKCLCIRFPELHPHEEQMPNPATESAEQPYDPISVGREAMNDCNFKGEQPQYRHPLANQAIAVDMMKQTQVPQRPTVYYPYSDPSVRIVYDGQGMYFADKADDVMDALEAQLAAALEREKDMKARLGPIAKGDYSGISGGGIDYVICSRKDANAIREALHARDVDPQLREACCRERDRAEAAEAERDRLRELLEEADRLFMVFSYGGGEEITQWRVKCAALKPPAATSEEM